MNEKERQEYLEQYKKEKEKGVPFFPDILFKDAVISLVIFIALVVLAYFVGAPLEPRADPADTSYTPRPEWYFLFLFQLLKYFPGSLEVIGVFIIPSVAIILLIALPLIDRSSNDYPINRLTAHRSFS
jgi:ubiquinol-cytochrome c reductase cytochrome b subunit